MSRAIFNKATSDYDSIIPISIFYHIRTKPMSKGGSFNFRRHRRPRFGLDVNCPHVT